MHVHTLLLAIGIPTFLASTPQTNHGIFVKAFHHPATTTTSRSSMTTTTTRKRGGIIPKISNLDKPDNAFKFSISSRGGGGVGSQGESTRGNVSMQLSPLVFDNAPFVQSIGLLSIANLVGFLISVATGSHLHLDLIGTGAFAIASLPTLFSTSLLRIKLSSAAICIWASKLAGFLFFRAIKVKHDARLDSTLSTFSGAFGFWMISLIWGVVCSLPHTLGTTSNMVGSPITLSIGSIVYLLGLITESMADYQKWNFKQLHPGKFCNVGLWSVSQHPNFFGNLVLWAGIFIMNCDSLIDPEKGVAGCTKILIATLSPLFMWTLFNGQATGSITQALEMANKKYGNDPGYATYISKTPLIIPNLLSWLRQLLPF